MRRQIGKCRPPYSFWLTLASITVGLVMSLVTIIAPSAYHISLGYARHDVYFFVSNDRSILCSVGEKSGWGHTVIDVAMCDPIDLHEDAKIEAPAFRPVPRWSQINREVPLDLCGPHNIVQMEGAFGYPFRAAAWLLVVEMDYDGNVRNERIEMGLLLSDSRATAMTGIAIPLRLLWVGFIGNVLVYSTAFAAAAASVIAIRSWRRRRAGRCLECGYDLRGCESIKCPECGKGRLKTGTFPTSAHR